MRSGTDELNSSFYPCREVFARIYIAKGQYGSCFHLEQNSGSLTRGWYPIWSDSPISERCGDQVNPPTSNDYVDSNNSS